MVLLTRQITTGPYSLIELLSGLLNVIQWFPLVPSRESNTSLLHQPQYRSDLYAVLLGDLAMMQAVRVYLGSDDS